MERGLFQDLNIKHDLKILGTARSQIAGEAAKHRVGRVPGIALLGFRHTDMVFEESGTNVLGLNYLMRYTVTFDFRNNVINLKKGKRFEPGLGDKVGEWFDLFFLEKP